MGSAVGTTIPTTFGQTKCHVLIDTGAMKSCMSQAYYQQLMLPSTRTIHTYQVKSVNGSNLCPIGITECKFKIGQKEYINDFVICKNLIRPCILRTDFLKKHGIFAGWTSTGNFKLISHQEFLVESLEILIKGPMIHDRQGIDIPGRSLAMVNASKDTGKLLKDQVFEVKPNFLLTNELNLSEDEKIFLRKGEILGHLEPCSIGMNDIVKEDWSEMEEIEGEENEVIPLEKKFIITSPAEVNTYRKMQLQDADIAKKYKEQFGQLCKGFEDIFSKNSTDIGKTPLITMDIDTGDSPPTCQKPYNLPLKHREWVQKELETLEKARVIVRSISPWANPIVVVPKKTEPGEPPRRRLCVDYRVINSLLPEVKKAHSKVKGVPLPQIDHIYMLG